MNKRVVYTVTFADDKPVTFGTVEAAIRHWDSRSYMTPVQNGSIAVQVWHNDVMVRDGYILQVDLDGKVYLSPTLSDPASLR